MKGRMKRVLAVLWRYLWLFFAVSLGLAAPFIVLWGAVAVLPLALGVLWALWVTRPLEVLPAARSPAPPPVDGSAAAPEATAPERAPSVAGPTPAMEKTVGRPVQPLRSQPPIPHGFPPRPAAPIAGQPETSAPVPPVVVPPPQDGAWIRGLRSQLPHSFEPDYERNAGVPGFIYLARNDAHAPGIYKLGQSTHPLNRLVQLNNDHAELGWPGTYSLVDCVPTSDALRTERLLFEWLTARRISPGREFFWATPEDIIPLFRAAASCIDNGSGHSIAQSAIGAPDPAWFLPPSTRANPTPLGPGQDGWIGILRNPVYRANVFRLVGGVTSPIERAKQLDAAARERTTGIGYFEVVYQVGLSSARAAFETVKRSLRSHAMPTGTNFYEIPLSSILTEVNEAVRYFAEAPATHPPLRPAASGTRPAYASPASRPSPPKRPPQPPTTDAELGPDEVFWITAHTAPAHPSYAPWTVACGGCQLGLRIHGRIGDIGIVRCPRCGHQARYRQGASGAVAMPTSSGT